jgi:hypothetical protein
MSTANQVSILLEWCSTNSIFIESTVRVDGDEQGGIGVFSADEFIPPNSTCMPISASVFCAIDDEKVVRIPKTSIISVRTCSLAGVVPFNPYGVGAQLSCSLALYVEMCVLCIFLKNIVTKFNIALLQFA